MTGTDHDDIDPGDGGDEEIDLATLGDEDLTLQMHDDLYDGLKEEIEEGVNILLGRGWAPYDVLTKALVEGMRTFDTIENRGYILIDGK